MKKGSPRLKRARAWIQIGTREATTRTKKKETKAPLQRQNVLQTVIVGRWAKAQRRKLRPRLKWVNICWHSPPPSVKRPAPRGNAPPRWHCWQVTGLFMLAPEKGEQRKGVRRIVQSAGKGRGRAASLCLSYFFASNRLTRPFGYAPLADSATVGAPFGVVGVLSGFMALSGLIFGWVAVSGAIWNKISTSPCGHPCLSHNTPPSAH